MRSRVVAGIAVLLGLVGSLPAPALTVDFEAAWATYGGAGSCGPEQDQIVVDGFVFSNANGAGKVQLCNSALYDSPPESLADNDSVFLTTVRSATLLGEDPIAIDLTQARKDVGFSFDLSGFSATQRDDIGRPGATEVAISLGGGAPDIVRSLVDGDPLAFELVDAGPTATGITDGLSVSGAFSSSGPFGTLSFAAAIAIDVINLNVIAPPPRSVDGPATFAIAAFGLVALAARARRRVARAWG